MDLYPIRYHGESQKAYRERQKNNNRSLKNYLRRGTVLWTSCVLQNGKEMLKHWLRKHPRASDAEIATVKRHYPENQLFKVAISGTYRRPGTPKILAASSTQPAPAVLAALKKHRRKKAQAESRRLAKLAARA